ncbi:MAG: hypothetical protein JXB62_14180 [Pirellulales bacterium]|nr:hypothetical protein [Pirellulales bacterium]
MSPHAIRSPHDATRSHRNRPILVRRALLLALLVLGLSPIAAYSRDRWTSEQAQAWSATQPWLVGSNFIPSTAINQLEMWQPDTFDPDTIDRELGWAAGLGFTSVRVFLHDLLWQQDREGFLKRIEQFLDIAEKHKIGVMMVPLDGVWDPNPALGKQRDPKPHVHNSGWLQAPGAALLRDPKRHDELKPYVQGVIRRFRDDCRIQVWDLFNEPDNPNRNSYGAEGTRTELPEDVKAEMATRLLAKLFVWAREVAPTQPLTAGVWRDDWSSHDRLSPCNRLMLEQSDVISFHCYGGPPQMQACVKNLRRYGRPILCTEYMSRGSGSTFDPLLGYLKRQHVGAYNWGLVNGKTQTIYPWETWTKRYSAEPDIWFHDIFRGDGSPYRQAEVDYIRRQTR